jgi:hypothetical protein
MCDFVDDFLNNLIIEEAKIEKVKVDIPKRIFIVPYRNRIQQKFFFCQQMNFILEGQSDYEILFVHQLDSRPFNRGATKNIGFIASKNKYPDSYKNITFIFNDVDTLPFHKLFDYQTVAGVVKHYYGFESSLGGIVVIKGLDFELVNGYPQYWGWGMEDACLQNRCANYKIKIDRSHFFPIGSPEILQLFDGVARLVSAKDPQRLKQDRGLDGIKTIHKLIYSRDKESSNPQDNIYAVENDRIFYINVSSFMTLVPFESDSYHEYDLRESTSKIAHPNINIIGQNNIGQNNIGQNNIGQNNIGQNKNHNYVNNNWQNIPFMPQFKEIDRNVSIKPSTNKYSLQNQINKPTPASKSANVKMSSFRI